MSEQPPGHPAQDPAQPPQNPYQPYGAPGYSATGVPQWAPDHPQSATVLILGILGITLCQVVAPFAWVMGRRVKGEITASGGRYGGHSQAQVGYVLGVVGSCLLIAYIVFGLLYVVFLILFIGASSTA